MEAELGHFGDAGGEGDEGPDDGKEAGEEDGDAAVALEEVLGAVEVVAEPMLQPMAPAVAIQKRLRRPVWTRYPAKGMMISLGRGMQADSMAMRRATPA